MNADDLDVVDESNSTKRRRTCRALNKPVRNIHSWETLPFPATIAVFSRLSYRDRAAMSQVCRNWNSCFKNPSLWRYRPLIIDGKYDRRDILFTSVFGRCLQYVEIEIEPEHYGTVNSIAKSVAMVTENLKNARLHHFALTFTSSDEFNGFSKNKLLDAIKNSFIKLFKIQTGLKKVTLASCHFSQSIGTEILKTLATSTGSELVYLDITNYIDRIFNVDTVWQTLAKFSNLTSVSVHYSYISDEVLRHWAVSLRHKLEAMRIIVSNREPHNHIIQRLTWKEISSSCPKLKVTMVIVNFSQAKEIISTLVPSIPLLTFIMKSRSNVQSSQLASTLKHLSNCYHHRLEHVIIECWEMQDSVDEGIIDVLEQCRKLKTFRFFGKFSVMVPNKICDLLSDGQSPLCTCQVGLATFLHSNVDQGIVEKCNLIRFLLPRVNDTDHPWDDGIYVTGTE